MGKDARCTFDQEGITEEIKQDRRKGERERKTNNNNDLM
jgi:hypothetical protein